MVTKIYGIYGRTEAHINLPINRGLATLKLEFTKGCVASGPGYRPATYATSDKAEQILIENSSSFGGLIRLVRVLGKEEQEETPAPKAVMHEVPSFDTETKEADETAQKVASTVYADVTDIEQVRSILKAAGAKAPTLTSLPAMARYAKANNIEFPNFSFD